MTHYSLLSYDNLQGNCYSSSTDEPCWGAVVLCDLDNDITIHLCEGHADGTYKKSTYPNDSYSDVFVSEI